jgi:hypothetical protein
METVTNDNGGQDVSPADAAAGQTGQDSAEAPETTDSDHQDDQDQDDEGQGDESTSEGDQGGRRNREAAYRRRAQAAEAERDTLRAQLDTLHRQIVGTVAKAHGLPEVGLLEYAGHELSSFITESGEVDADKVIEATKATMQRVNTRKTVAPNLQQGARSVPAASGGLADVLNKALGR